MKGNVLLNNNRATKTVASTFGVLVGLAGIQHGIFETLQGNIATNDFMIDAIDLGKSFGNMQLRLR